MGIRLSPAAIDRLKPDPLKRPRLPMRVNPGSISSSSHRGTKAGRFGKFHPSAEDVGAARAEAAWRWGEIIYRIATALAVLIGVLAIAAGFYEVSESEPVVPVPALVLAISIWLIGYGCRRLLVGR